MALTLAQRTQLRKRAAQEAAKAAPVQLMDGLTTYELMLAKLQQDQLRLKQVQSNQGKAELKTKLLPDYAPYVEGVLAGGAGAQDDVLTTLMVWYFDASQFEQGLQIADYVLKYNLLMPDRFTRTTGCLIAEEVAEAALKTQKAGGSFDRVVLEEAMRLTIAQDMPDEARAKLYLALGRADLADSEVLDGAVSTDELLGMARQHLAAAIDLHSNCGAKKDLERTERLLKKYAPADAAQAPDGQGEQLSEG